MNPEGIPIQFERIMSELEINIMSEIVRAIEINGFSTATADWQMERLIYLGKSEKEIKKYVQKALDLSDKELEKLYSDEVFKEYYKYDRAYKLKGVEQIPFKENTFLQSLIKAVKEQTKEEFRNITQSMGFAKRNPITGKLSYEPIAKFYQDTLDEAIMGISSGALTYDKALSNAVEIMTFSGLRWVDYESGWHNRVDVAARRAVMTGFRQVQGKINEQVAADLDTDSFEVSWHMGARPEHQVWQGRVYTYSELQTICGLGTGPGLHGWNCYHDYSAFIPGISVRTYTDEQLDEMNAKENETKSYNGKEYTKYKALQEQRRRETAMRKTRQDIKLLKEGKASKDVITIKEARYRLQQQQYKSFSKAMDLPEQMKRVYQDGLKIGTNSRNNTVTRLSDTTDKWARESRKELLKSEKSISGRKYETLEVYDAKGKFLFSRRGGSESVSFSVLDYMKLKGAVVTHNHPSGGSFSTQDIIFLKNMPISELRATTEDCSYYIRKPSHWPENISTSKEITNARNQIRMRLKNKYKKLYNEGEITKEERHKLFSEEVNKQFAERFGFEYGREFFE